ncbi:hypothetical protein ON058_01370 [Demequina sp. B12]|uniref:transglutaminase domain-containing protein n=1 Tax=Demequina sp. B12 TaxID=2992757 RepID=UPI00237C3387|nr:transglutaminase domain-containing protein [Demequina sp. B12]MDE0572061.1 hypothetical protein [Demequina sp. B12]
MTRRPRRASAATLSFAPALINTLFVIAGAAVAAWTLASVYGSQRYLLVMLIAVFGGAGTAFVVDRWGRRGGTVALIVAALYVVVGLTLVVPGATSGVDSALGAALELVRGPVLGWKDIVTLPVPLGEYRATLVPVFALFLIASAGATWLALRSPKWGWGAVVLGGLQVAAIGLGPAVRSEPLAVAPFGVVINHEFVVGLAQFLVILAWFSWRAAAARKAAITHAQDAGTARLAQAPHSRVLAGTAAVAAMVTASVAVALLAAGPIAAHTPREVARSAVDPRLTVESAASPLSAFRTFFTDEVYDEVLFTVAVDDGEPERIRIASLSYYDGETFSASAPDGQEARFERVPARLDGQNGASHAAVTVSVGAGDGIWVPLVGELESITFDGARRSQLVDSFYYDMAADTGVIGIDGGLATGDGYEVSGYVTPGVAVSQMGPPPGKGSVNSSFIPESLRDWVANQGVTKDGEGLAQLITTLRERTYLSHALMEGDEVAAWQQALGDYAFMAAPSGHSYDHMDRMFTALNEQAVAAGEGASEAQLVAYAADDEQLATAVALIASDMGYPVRVVMGTRLETTDAEGYAAPACDAGECRGQNMSAWVEVQGQDGVWVAADVTPQHTNVVSPDVSAQTDPEFASPLDPRHAEAIVPPSTQRGTSDDSSSSTVEEEAGESALIPVLRVVGASMVGLLILLGPFLAILIWKAIRRSRRRSGEPQDSIHGGWDEYLDSAADAGLAAMPLATRHEVAAAYGSAHGPEIARLTDKATFGAVAVAQDEADHFWTLVDEERSTWLRDRRWWARVRMRLSLRSLWRSTSATSEPEAAPSDLQRVHWRSDHTGATGTRLRRGRTRTRQGRGKGKK